LKENYKNSEQHNYKEEKRILHLVNLHNITNMENKSIYNIYKITRNYYELFDNISTYYYCYNDNDNEPEIKDDIILIPRKYNSIIKTLDMTRGMNYDYVLISDITTVVNLKLLNKFLIKNKIDYGIYDNNYTGKILSKKTVDLMLDKNLKDIVPIFITNNSLNIDITNIKRIRKYLKDTIFYINRNNNKITDLKRIEIIINKLINI
jgi:hypothetical protein